MLGHNLYIYCNNNPINMKDITGNFAISAIATCLAVVGEILVKTVITVGVIALAAGTIYVTDKIVTAAKEKVKEEFI